MVSWQRWSSVAAALVVCALSAATSTEASTIRVHVQVGGKVPAVDADAKLSALDKATSDQDCVINGVKLPHRSLHYYAENAYVACSRGQAGCYLIEKVHDEATQVSCPDAKVLQDKIAEETKRREKRRLSLAVVDPKRKWAGGVVCYDYNEDYPFTATQKSYIRDAMKVYESYTSVRFLPIGTCQSKKLTSYCDGCVDYVDFKHPSTGRDCNSSIGVNDVGPQIMNLADRCFEVDDDLKTNYGSAMHEIGHSIGLYHEHQHPGRKIGVFWDDISQSLWAEMKQRDVSVGGEYDPDSVMHYPMSYGFCYPTYCSSTVTKNCVPEGTKFCNLNDDSTTCVEPTQTICDVSRTKTIGQRKGLSQGDLDAINELYSVAAWSATASQIA
ncbi:Metalloprotease family m12a, partial [Globisporangium splendens]